MVYEMCLLSAHFWRGVTFGAGWSITTSPGSLCQRCLDPLHHSMCRRQYGVWQHAAGCGCCWDSRTWQMRERRTALQPSGARTGQA
jgi:hypothetical protein